MNLLKRIKTLWILSGWNIKAKKVPGAFTFDGILRPEITDVPKKKAQIIRRKSPTQEFLNGK